MPTSSTKMLVVHIVILVLDQTVVSISEVGECLVHLFTIVQVLGLVNFEAVVLSVSRKLEDGGRYRTWWPNIMKWPVFFSQVTLQGTNISP